MVAATAQADNGPLLDSVRKYGGHVDLIERSAGKASLMGLIQEGTALADRLRPVIPDLSETDYKFVKKHLKGFVVNRQEVIVVEPDTAFFRALAEKHGTDNDRLFSQFLHEWMPAGTWPVYINLQTDFGGCTRFGDGFLAELYLKGNKLLPQMTGYYAREITKIVKEVSFELTAGTCACRDRQSVIKEFEMFLDFNSGSELSGAIKNRLEKVREKRDSIRYYCSAGS